MSKTGDTSTRIWHHCVAGMHVGCMDPMPYQREFDAVLTVGANEGVVEDGLRHKHLPLPYVADMNRADLDQAAEWVLAQVREDRRVLVRSDGGKQRPGLVVAYVVLLLGGYYTDAILSVQVGNLGALSDFRYLALLREIDAVVNPRATAR